MTDDFTAGAEAMAEQIAKHEADRTAADQAAEDRRWNLDPARQAYLREHHAGGDLSIDDWNAMTARIEHRDPAELAELAELAEAEFSERHGLDPLRDIKTIDEWEATQDLIRQAGGDDADRE